MTTRDSSFNIYYMIISKYIENKLGKNYTIILKKYNISEDYKYGDIINVPIDKISHGSSIIIDVSCDYCGDILHIPYKRYIFAVQITMQRKVDFKRKFYVICNEAKKQAS